MAEAASALVALDEAVQRALGAVEQIGDDDRGFEQAGELAERLRLAADRATALRVHMVGRMWDACAGNLSLADLGDRLGVSKSRADQLVRAANKARQATEPTSSA